MNLTLMFRILVSILLLTSTVRAFAQAPNANAGPDVTICANAQTTLNGSASGGQGPYQYSWAPATGLSNPNISNPVCTVNNTTIYTLTVTGANNQTGTDQVTVTVPPTAVALLSSSNASSTTFNGFPTIYKCSPNPNSLFSFDFAGTADVFTDMGFYRLKHCTHGFLYNELRECWEKMERVGLPITDQCQVR